MLFLVIVVVVLVIIGLAVLSWLQEQKRREAFQQLALELGLSYVAKDRTLPDRYAFLNALRQGDDRYAFNVLAGTYQEYPVQAFDYHYETHSSVSKGQSQTQHHYFSFFILQQERSFPELRIYPEGLLSKLGQMLGFADIHFESSEFSRAFAVRSQDRKFAYDICHPRMMEYLLAHRDLSLEIEGRCVAMSFDRRLKPEEIPGRLQELIEIRQLFPGYLYRD
jgi:hypothetical protein